MRLLLCCSRFSALKNSKSTAALATPLKRTRDKRRQDEHGADDDDRRIAFDARQRKSVLNQLDHHKADDRAPDCAEAPKNTGPAETARGDDIEFVADTHVRARGGDAGNEHAGR